MGSAAEVRTTAVEQFECYSVGMGLIVACTAVGLAAGCYCRRTPMLGFLESVQYSEASPAVEHKGSSGSWPLGLSLVASSVAG